MTLKKYSTETARSEKKQTKTIKTQKTKEKVKNYYDV